jgi:DnaJ-class molecular chaperone
VREMATNRKTKRETPRRCQSCKTTGSTHITVTFDPATRWWLCDTCLKRARDNRSNKK